MPNGARQLRMSGGLRGGILAMLIVSLLAGQGWAGQGWASRRGSGGLLRRLFSQRCPNAGPAAACLPGDKTPPDSPPTGAAPSVGEAPPTGDAPPTERSSPSDLPDTAAWKDLFDGTSLDGWKSTNFGGEGEVLVEDGMIILEMGNSLTGVHYTGYLPLTNYEVEFEGKRLSGIDFFCGVTFPVNDSHCSFIAGGWAGGIVGLSSIDGLDASENETTKYMTFDNDRWYRFRVRVQPESIAVWIDDQSVVYQNIRDRRISTRSEVDPSRPFGFSAWQTKGAIRKIRLRTLPAESADDS